MNLLEGIKLLSIYLSYAGMIILMIIVFALLYVSLLKLLRIKNQQRKDLIVSRAILKSYKGIGLSIIFFFVFHSVYMLYYINAQGNMVVPVHGILSLIFFGLAFVLSIVVAFYKVVKKHKNLGLNKTLKIMNKFSISFMFIAVIIVLYNSII